MCGKFTQEMPYSKMVRLYNVHEEPEEQAAREAADAERGEGEDRVEGGTPMRFMRVIALDNQGRRRIVRMRWGFDAPWEKGPRQKLIIHARYETVDELKTFRKAFAEGRRGIVVVKTFNEGEELANGKTKQYVITPNDGSDVVIAVLWEYGTAPDGSPVPTFVMVTTPPNKLIATITDRMPAALASDDIGVWLGEVPATPDQVKATLRPFEGDWSMAPQEPPGPPRSPKERRPPPRKTDKPSPRDLFDL